jgi:hypothetical protein
MAKSRPRKSKASVRVPKRPVRRNRSRPLIGRDEWPAGLRLLVKAAQAERPKGHGEALASLIAFAFCHVPARGVFDPGEEEDVDFYKSIADAAKAYLGLDDARAELKAALDKAQLSWDRRDEIESAVTGVRVVSDTSNYYAGLAFGLVFASMSGAVSR